MKQGMIVLSLGGSKKKAPRHADAAEESAEPKQETPKEESQEDLKARIGFKDASRICETCSNYDGGECKKYKFPSDPEDSCEEGWTDSSESEETADEKGGSMLDAMKETEDE